jgi:FkbM family methyltransferase
MNKSFEVQGLAAHLQALFALLRIDCVLDVGGHHGEYGHFLRQLGYNGKIISFEPAPPSYAQLARRCAADPCWSAHPLALGATEGTARLHVTRDTLFSSLLQPNPYCFQEFGDLGVVEQVTSVPVRRLDSLVQEGLIPEESRRVFLKLDTQGYDLKVLEGGGKFLDHVQALQTELSIRQIYQEMPSYLEAIPHLNRYGFELTAVVPITRDRYLRIIEFDGVLVKSNAS